ncbi:MAG: FecR domain-containing protein [Pseudoalteromonas sp.]|uniref:FecR family protein n=1 Tax=Pseudoalteromonas sp. TaxID=53249 RepID=UPI0025E666E8|nr:FecR domain-containing protein [Pseudoalteromonas sp.]MCH2086300.1 FecR domain-containing protein [Pseudoalteromonas sp.]
MSVQYPDYKSKLEQAANWCVLLNSDNFTDADIQAHSQWLKADPENQKAYSELQALWREFDSTDNSHFDSKILNRVLDKDKPKSNHFAKSVVLSALFVGFGLIASHVGLTGISSDYYTLKGEQKTVELKDGSILTLNAQTQVDIEFSSKQRLIKLNQGEIHLVAKTNSSWPLVVETDNATATALGTQFTVKRHEQDTFVVVSESKVELCYLPAQKCVVGKEGQAMSVANSHLIGPTAANPDIELAWLNNRLVANNMSLARLLSLLEPHYQGVFIYNQSALEHIRVSGVYPTDNIAMALQMIASEPAVTHTSVAKYFEYISLK